MTPHLDSDRRRWAVALIAAVLLLAAAACALSDDKRPRTLPKEALALLDSGSPTTTAPSGSNPNEVELYFIRDDHLVPITTTTSDTPTAEAVLKLLLAGPSELKLTQRVTSLIPANVTLHRAVKGGDGVLNVDLGPEISLITGNGAKAAYAQMVLTAKGLGIDRVKFSIDGVPIDAPTDEGNQSVVQAQDYKPPLNPG